MAKLVIFDMDGVLADIESSWSYVHGFYGVSNEHSLDAYLRGDIDDLEFIRRDIRLWREKDPELNVEQLREILSGVPLMPGAAKTIEHLGSAGVKTAIVSAGIDLLAEMIARELGIDMHLANGFVTDGGGRLSGEGVLNVKLTDKGDAVETVAESFHVQKRDIVSVGNSRYDVSMFRKSNLGIAFCPADEIVRKSAGVAIERKDLSELLKVI